MAGNRRFRQQLDKAFKTSGGKPVSTVSMETLRSPVAPKHIVKRDKEPPPPLQQLKDAVTPKQDSARHEQLLRAFSQALQIELGGAANQEKLHVLKFQQMLPALSGARTALRSTSKLTEMGAVLKINDTKAKLKEVKNALVLVNHFFVEDTHGFENSAFPKAAELASSAKDDAIQLVEEIYRTRRALERVAGLADEKPVSYETINPRSVRRLHAYDSLSDLDGLSLTAMDCLLHLRAARKSLGLEHQDSPQGPANGFKSIPMI